MSQPNSFSLIILLLFQKLLLLLDSFDEVCDFILEVLGLLGEFALASAVVVDGHSLFIF